MNDMMEESSKSVIANAWKAAGITKDLEFGVEVVEGLESLAIDPFS